MPHVRFFAIDFAPTPVDFFRMTVTGMIHRLRQYVLDRELDPVAIIGSSLGGLVASNYAFQYGGVTKLLLLAPALTGLHDLIPAEELAKWERDGSAPIEHSALGTTLPLSSDFIADGFRYGEAVPPPAPILIVHGSNDQAVPVVDSRRYADGHPGQVQLIEVGAGHDLNGHLGLIWHQVQTFLLELEATS